ncbi:MAG: tRNA (adenosine(37)-N6)-dimethylallyltransferase MiaA [Candidatus Devosia phytovorans]|uniref:tRNA dimethylallyltransferase n=1 Tax=Candidatus Devosia phytovorans TaxID=3121372 RepID=A0AAJ5VWP4_9HYPH|nr:tRNA (adenosine(37)-N6)-dimethylallyltransferase MiaA [Devosia sp.]WEK05476.1 MAG: tRNA (adenosine(37)-N6)-dimethylallyltransferase MiaA [Devosia sp.]
MTGRGRAVLIAGPTASGKSALALEMARERGGIIINADSMQIYDTLQVVTARPSDAEMAEAEHRLYGTVPAGQRFSTGEWLRAVEGVMHGPELIFVGGTGLYFDALLNGFADVPEIPAEIVIQIQEEIRHLTSEKRLELLEKEDPETAARLKIADPQRVTRALAVKRFTGQRLSSFQGKHAGRLLTEFSVERVVLDPERDVLRDRITKRFAKIFESGAVEEVEALLAMRLGPSLPVMKAIGVREIGDWLDGRISREEAISLATIATHQYAKRQRTWFRNRFADWPRTAPRY